MTRTPMTRFIITLGLVGAGAAGAQSLSVQVAPANSLEFGIHAGYYGGGSVGTFVTARNVGGSSFGLRGSFDYTGIDGLNDNASLTPGLDTPLTNVGNTKRIYEGRESGRNLTLGADVLYHLGYETTTGLGANVYAGVRYNLYQGALDIQTADGPGSYIVTSNQLGLGGGVFATYPIANNIYLTGDLGIDHYFPSAITITGRDPDGNVNSETIRPGDANYGGADNLANQPTTVLKAKLGIAVRF